MYEGVKETKAKANSSRYTPYSSPKNNTFAD
jgi:hypothetical protein